MRVIAFKSSHPVVNFTRGSQVLFPKLPIASYGITGLRAPGHEILVSRGFWDYTSQDKLAEWSLV